MLKRIVWSLALLPCWLSCSVLAADLPTYPFIHVGGEGYIQAMPDLGEIDFDITASGLDSAAALALVQQRIEEIRAMLIEQSGAPDGEGGVSVEVTDLRKDIRKSADSAAAPVYDIRSSVHLMVRDLTKWRPIMLALLEKPDLDHMSTSFGKTDRTKVEEELTADAIKDAQRRARAMAAGFGKKVGAVAAISSGQLRNLTKAVGLMPGDVYNARRGADTSSSPKDFLSIQVLRWSQSVDMIFRIQ